MTHKFFALLNRLKPFNIITGQQVNEIQKAAWKIEKTIEKHRFEQPEMIHQFAKESFNHISIEIKELKKGISEADNQIKSGMDSVKQIELDNRIAALTEIGSICEDLQATLLEHLIIFSPSQYELQLPSLEKMHPNSPTVQKIKIHKRALIAALEEKFSKTIPENEITDSDKVIKTFESEGKRFASIAFDFDNDTMFNDLLKTEQEKFLKLDSLNTIELFYSIEIGTAKEHQKQFPDHKTRFKTQDKYYFHLLQKWIDLLEKCAAKPKAKNEAELPKKLEDAFYDKKNVQPCIDILKELDPPILDDNGKFIGKLKAVLVVWIVVLQKRSIVRSYSNDRKVFPEIFKNEFKMQSFSGSNFAKHSTRANEYKNDIEVIISQIKLSQK
jgi:acyl carrier protein